MNKVFALLLLVFLALVGWVGAGPYWIAGEIRDGIRAGDTAKLERHVDFPQVRDSLKQQLSAAITARAEAESGDNPFAQMAAGIALALVDGMVDAFVTPAGLAGLSSGRAGGGSESPDGNGESRPEPFRNARYTWESHDRFAIRIPAENGEDVIFLLTRAGLQWQMTSILLPGLR